MRLQEGAAGAPEIEYEAVRADVFVWIKTHGWDTPGIEKALAGIRAVRVPIIAFHLDLYLPLPERWARYRNDPYMQMIDHFFTVDRLMADWLDTNTPVRGHYLPAAVYDPEAYIANSSGFKYDVVFVGSKGYHREWDYRPKLIDWLRETYGKRFTHVGGDGDTGTVRGAALNQLYADTKVVVGDTLCPNFDYQDYFSDRLFEAPGRGAFQVFPRIRGIERHFTDGENIVLYEFGDFGGLKKKIDYYLARDTERERIRRNGWETVKLNETYTQRWQQILKTLELS